MRPETWLETLNCAVEGIIHAVRTQRHMRWHVLACLAVLVVTPCLGITPVEFALLCLGAALVLLTELVNSAVEAAVDLASPNVHPLAGAAKDMAAGAVLVSAFAAVGVGWVVLFPHVRPMMSTGLHDLGEVETVGTVALGLAVVVLVVYFKARTGTGRPLHGGLPSGHAAVSFALATWLTLYTADPLVAMLSLLLAAMVSHSRLLHRIHSVLEVVVGAALGACCAVFLYWLFT